MNRKIRIGVFGAKRGGSMLTTLWDHPTAELAAVCDRYQPALDRIAERAARHGVEVALFNNFDDFLASDIDAVILANYAHEHAPYAIRCLEAGRHVLSEVLPAATVGQCVALIEAVEKSGLVYAYAENYCYMRHTFELWRRVRAGDFGRIVYAEGEYIHDCTSVIPSITYGDPNHWRNTSAASFYCTHSIGPLLMAIGQRPVQVVGYELENDGREGRLPYNRGMGALEMVTLADGTVCRSLHGWLRREGANKKNYVFYGTRGMAESPRFGDMKQVSAYLEGEKFCAGEWTHYAPEPFIDPGLDAETLARVGHAGGDYYPVHFFLERIRGNAEAAQWSVDVYQAVDMGLCGLLAHRSILNGNRPEPIPDLRDPAQRDACRHDHDTTFPDIVGGTLVPQTALTHTKPGDEAYYAHIRQLWSEGKKFETYP